MCIVDTLFIDNLVSDIRMLGITEIPFDNDAFYDGVANLNKFYLDNVSSMGEYGPRLESLFEKNIFVNFYPKFRIMFMKLDGTLLNIVEDSANICLSIDSANKIKKFVNIGLSESMSRNLAEAFLEGMNVCMFA